MKRRASRIRFFVPLLFCAGIAVTVAGCAPIAERKDTPVVRTAPKPPHPSPAVNTRSTYVADDAGDALRKWIRPNGSLDRDRVDVINKFIAEKKFNPVPQVTTFLTGATYAEARAELARRLGLIR